MAGFLGLGNKRFVGLCVSAGLLLASCTQVVKGKGAADEVALTSYLAASSSSAASVSSSKAAAAQKAVCSQLIIGYVRFLVAWNAFVDALNKAGTAEKNQMDDLFGAIGDASSQMKSANADSSTDIGGAASVYTDALDKLAGLLKKGNGTIESLNDASHQVTSAKQKLLDLCPN
ncbi:MAG: hypothetical protein ACRC20_11570 [Segniliparus sp.]|uniref:hypothetical protein n=1 Tax=Segniliparus sp. TaxID=2804064 RepID=UPI003F38349C